MTSLAPNLFERITETKPTANTDDVEKTTRSSVNEVSSVDQKNDSDADSANFQGGVKRVRAITSVWSKQTLWTMFALYVVRVSRN